jgi:hypothetical protein
VIGELDGQPIKCGRLIFTAEVAEVAEKSKNLSELGVLRG